MPTSLGDRRVTAPARPEAMAAWVERRLVVRAEYLVHRLLHDPVDHVRYTKPSLPATRLRDPYPANQPRVIAPIQQGMAERRQNLFEVLSHLAHALSIRSGSAIVTLHALKCSSQVSIARYLFHRHRGRVRAVRVLRLRHRMLGRKSGSVPPLSRNGPSRAVGCLGEQWQLARRFAGRDRFPSPRAGRGWDRLSAAFRYSAIIRLLSSRRHLVVGP